MHNPPQDTRWAISKCLLLLLLPVLCNCSCYTKIARTTGVDEIRFGQGGGFANQSVTYTLNKKGELSKKQNVIATLPCEDLERVFSAAAALGEPINDPDNIYWFIEVIGKQTRKYVWGGATKDTQQLKNLYTELNKLKK